MTTRYRRFEIQLQEGAAGSDLAGPSLITSGGKMIVTGRGTALRSTLYDANGASLANPVSFTAGHTVFYTLDTVASVDLYGLTGDGRAFQQFAVQADAAQMIVCSKMRDQVLAIPIHNTDFAATVETATGFLEPTGAIFTADAVGVNCLALHASKTLDVGTLSSDTGDADGFISAIDVGTTGYKVDNGALFSSGAPHVSGGKSITATTSSGSTTLDVIAYLPYTLFGIGWPIP